MPDTAFVNGKFTTLDADNPHAEAVFVKNGVFQVVGTTEDVLQAAGRDAREIDLQGRAVLPGLNDSHIHIIRGGLNYNMELRWDGVPSLSDAMQMLRRQVDITPAPQWVRVVGGFTLQQFAEKRLPTLDELNDVAPDTPVFILHLYDRALLNRAAIRACGFDRSSPNPPGGEIERDSRGEPTGMIVAKPNAAILYIALARGPKLTPDDQLVSTRQFMRELNRLGVTSAIDAGGGFQNYPDDYRVIDKLARRNELTVRIAYNLFTQNPGGELEDFSKWTASLRPGSGDDVYRLNGAGEMLVYSAADFENFRLPRPDMPGNMEGDLEQVIRVLLEKRWPFRLHATYDETIRRALDVFERVNRDIPFEGLHWFFDHAETIGPESIDRVAALHGGIAVQHRMAYQGEFFVDRYGAEAAVAAPPVRRILDAGIPVGAGTDATRVASYNPWVCLCWLVTGKTYAGLQLTSPENVLDRLTALRLYTVGSAWFSNSADKKGRIAPGQLADFMVPSVDYFAVPADDIKYITSDLTVLGGNFVYGDGVFKGLGPGPLQVSPSWSPVRDYPGYTVTKDIQAACAEAAANGDCTCGGCATGPAIDKPSWVRRIPEDRERYFWDSLSCGCWL